MDKKIARARDMVPSIIITVLSMIQALALELYWTRIQDSDFLWNVDWIAALGWVQLVVVLLGIIQIWLMYVSLMLRFSWLPSMWDTVIPFAIGLLEFALIDLMGPENLGIWFLVLAIVFGLTIGAAHTAHRQARLDSENDYFFDNISPANWGDYAGSIVSIGLLAVFGAVLHVTGDRGVLAMAALLLAAFMLAYQLTGANRYWMHTLVKEENG
jgi:hypothetical protein